jgi:hypothetical protein
MIYFSKKRLEINNLSKICFHTSINFLFSFQEKKRKLFYHTSSQRYCKKNSFNEKKAKSLKAYRKKPEIEKKQKLFSGVFFFGEQNRTERFLKKDVRSISLCGYLILF